MQKLRGIKQKILIIFLQPLSNSFCFVFYFLCYPKPKQQVRIVPNKNWPNSYFFSTFFWFGFVINMELQVQKSCKWLFRPLQNPLLMSVMELNVSGLTTVLSSVNLTSLWNRVLERSVLYQYVKYDIIEEKQQKGFSLLRQCNWLCQWQFKERK